MKILLTAIAVFFALALLNIGVEILDFIFDIFDVFFDIDADFDNDLEIEFD